MTQHPYDDLQSFVLGDLDAAAAEEVLLHSDSCASCAAVLASSMQGIAVLAEAEQPREASKEATSRASKVIPLTAWARRSSWLLGLTTAAALIVGVWNVDLQATRPVIPIDSLVHSHFTHHPLTGNGGNAKLLQALDGSWVYVVADGLRPFERYQLTVDGEAVGAVNANSSGQASGYWTRTPTKVTDAALTGPNGTALRWHGK